MRQTLTVLQTAGKLDSDNLPGAFKHVRDGMADALGIDDGDARLAWSYAQVKAKRGKCFATIVVELRQRG